MPRFIHCLIYLALFASPALAVRVPAFFKAVPEATPAMDTTPPTIVVSSPDRRLQTLRAAELTIAGKATDESGIARVTVNGAEAALDRNGNFSAKILLKVGENIITVTATDINRNQSSEQLTIERAAVFVALPDSSPDLPVIGQGRYHALLIAVENYTVPGVSRLDFPLKDAQDLKQTLVATYTFDPMDVTILANPDRQTILKTLHDLKDRLTPQDSLLIFYAGHGIWLDDMQQGYWLPRDAAGSGNTANWISNSDIRDHIKAIKARHILLVTDACFSGGLFKVRGLSPQKTIAIEKMYELASRKAITSGAMKTVPDKSVFAKFLVKRLQENREPYLDAQKLFVSFKEAVINNSSTGQTPIYGAITEAGDEGGDFIFVRR